MHKITAQKLVRSLLIGILTLTAGIGGGSAQSTFNLVNETTLINHWPGVDGLIGTADDVISSTPSTTNISAPNIAGALSYNAFDFGQGPVPDSALFPPNRQAITFLDAGNTVAVDMSVAENGGGPLILGWDLSGSEPFPFHGPYAAQITTVNSGSYNPVDHTFSQNIDFTANLAGGTSNSSSFDLSGTAYLVQSSEYAGGTGNGYVDSVLIPLAQTMGADALFFATGAGTVPAADNGGFPQMDITATVFGLLASGGTTPEHLTIALSASRQAVVSWPTGGGDPTLESSPVLGAAEMWTAHERPYAVANGQNSVTVPTTEAHRFFRLRSNQ